MSTSSGPLALALSSHAAVSSTARGYVHHGKPSQQHPGQAVQPVQAAVVREAGAAAGRAARVEQRALAGQQPTVRLRQRPAVERQRRARAGAEPRRQPGRVGWLRRQNRRRRLERRQPGPAADHQADGRLSLRRLRPGGRRALQVQRARFQVGTLARRLVVSIGLI